MSLSVTLISEKGKKHREPPLKPNTKYEKNQKNNTPRINVVRQNFIYILTEFLN